MERVMAGENNNKHLLAKLWGGQRLNDKEIMKQVGKWMNADAAKLDIVPISVY